VDQVRVEPAPCRLRVQYSAATARGSTNNRELPMQAGQFDDKDQ